MTVGDRYRTPDLDWIAIHFAPVRLALFVTCMRRFSAVVVLLLIAGCGKQKIPAPTLAALEGADQYELLSLNSFLSKGAPSEGFYRWRVLGRTSISDKATRKKLNDALRAGVRESVGAVASCFNARHAIHVTRAGKVTDVVICFECLHAKVITDGESSGGFLTTESPQEVFDNVLKEAGIPLAAKPK